MLAIYSGGTLGMVNSSNGYSPSPGLVTETFRLQSRFHDPLGDSIFSWSDTHSRLQQWTATYGSTPPSRAQSPRRSGASSNSSSSRDASPGPTAGLRSSLPATGPPFSKPVTVRSSQKGVSTQYAVSQSTLPDGTLSLELPSLITPKSSHNQQRIRYTVLEYDPLLDSSEMGLEDWLRMAKDIELNYANFDAFVILHGTDTMSFTASAMSFLLENLGKTVIVTGAQVPLSELRNDAVENVLGALILASTYIIPEVCLFFASTLYRGNRTSKVSNNALSAFDSPNLPPLARVGIGIDVAWNLVERSRSVRPFRAHDKMCSDVALLRLFPGMPTDTIKTFLSSNIQGLCIESFGAGNAPSRPDLLQAFQEATDRGVVIVNITQCLQGEVSAIYAVGKKLAAVGVVAGADLTPECALTKLAYLLSKPELSRQQVRELMGRSLRGELTARSPSTGHAHLGRSSMSDLLAKILQKPSEPQDEGPNGDHLVGKAAEGKAVEREIADAERAVLPCEYRTSSRVAITILADHLHLVSLTCSSRSPSRLPRRRHLSRMASLLPLPTLLTPRRSSRALSSFGPSDVQERLFFDSHVVFEVSHFRYDAAQSNRRILSSTRSVR